MKRSGQHLDWAKQADDVAPDWGSDDKFVMGHPAELAKAIVAPIQAYPMFETALMHSSGLAPAEHLAVVGEMWAGFSRVAADNPNAWRREAFTAEEILTATADNRYVGWPYTKRMVSNPDCDMATGIIVCSAGRAEAAGIPRDRWVFVHGGTDSKDRVMSERLAFDASPSIGVAGRRALELAGVGLDDVAHLDVYSCFPSAVELFCREFDLDPLARPLTVYGGLCFAGGPWNNPVGHALATMVDVLRADAGTLGFVTGNGGNVDKHSFTVLGTEPPAAGYRHERPQAEIDAQPGRTVLDSHEGPVEVEAWSVMHSRDNSPERFHAACLTPGGERVWAITHDADVMAAAVTDRPRRHPRHPRRRGPPAPGILNGAPRGPDGPATAAGELRMAMMRSEALGNSSSSALNARVSKRSRVMGPSATTVAVRGRWSMRAISPIVEPGPVVAAYSPLKYTPAVPSTTT